VRNLRTAYGIIMKLSGKHSLDMTKRYFLNEMIYQFVNDKSELYKRSSIIPQDKKELRRLEEMSMDEIREHDPKYWKVISDAVTKNIQTKMAFMLVQAKHIKAKINLIFKLTT